MNLRHFLLPIACLLIAVPAAACAQGAARGAPPPPTPATPAPAAPAAATPAMSERDRLGSELVTAALGAGFDDKFMANLFASFDSGADLTKYRPEWAGLMRESLAAEVRAYLPRYKMLMARELLGDFTVEELRAGVAFARSPGGRRLIARTGVAATPAERQAMADLGRTPAGRSFLRKYNAMKPSDATRERIDRMASAEILPRTYLAFVRAARANEAKRPALDANGQLALKVAHAIAVMRDFQGGMAKSTPDLSGIFADPSYPASWRDLISEAARDEFKNRPDLMEIALAPALVRYLSPEELATGAAFLDSPAGQELIRVSRARQDGDASADLDKASRKAFQKLMSQPAGKGFIEKIDHLDRMGDNEFSTDFVVAFLLDVFEAFSLKAQLAAPQAS